jgi:hypothetical protein
MKWTVLGAIMMAGLLFVCDTPRAEEAQEFSFKGLVLEAMNADRILINETRLKITNKTKVLNLQGNPVNANALQVGDRVRVRAEHKKGYDEALKIVQMPKRSSKR